MVVGETADSELREQPLSLTSGIMVRKYFSACVGVSLGLACLAGAQEKKDEAPEEAKKASSEALKDPSKATEKAPDKFKAKFETTAGDFTVEVTRDLSPRGADRFYNLVKIGFFEDIAFFRVIDGFMAQFGIHGDPEVSAIWRKAQIQDDPEGKASNEPGALTFATAGPNTRTTQFFLNLGDNKFLDNQGFTPIGKVVEGMENVKKIFKGYGEGAPRGQGPSQALIQSQGNPYLKEKFPKLDYVKSVTLVNQ